jgi:hypothetical protein
MATSGGDGGELQFDRAEYTGGSAAPACANCQRAIAGEYHQLNGKIFCADCRTRLEQSIGKLHESASLGRGLLFGLGAAIAGGLLFWAVRAITGYQFGLLAVVVGFLVGKAVRIGSRSLGGWKYQALAMSLAYLSMVSIYTPEIDRTLRNGAEKARKAAQEKASPGAPAPPGRVVHIGPAYYLLLLGVALIYPWLGGFSNILGLIIIGIGLWEAWKFNRRVEIRFTGPFSAAGNAPASET